MTRRLAVHKGDQVWKWTCCVPFCHVTDWSVSQQRALAAGQAHLRTHQRFGFSAKGGHDR